MRVSPSFARRSLIYSLKELRSPSCPKSVVGNPKVFTEKAFPSFFLPPLAGGSARVPCQISDLAGWAREGEIFQQRDFLRRSHPHPNPLPSRERGKERRFVILKIFNQASRCICLKQFGFLIETLRNDG